MRRVDLAGRPARGGPRPALHDLRSTCPRRPAAGRARVSSAFERRGDAELSAAVASRSPGTARRMTEPRTDRHQLELDDRSRRHRRSRARRADRRARTTTPGRPTDAGGTAGGPQEPQLPAALARPGGDPDRRQHGRLRADRARLLGDRVELGGEPAAADLPRAGRLLLGGRRRLRRPARPAGHPDRHEPAPGDLLRPRLRGRREPRGDLRPQHRDLDRHDVLRAGRGGDDPGARPAPAAARRERPVHVHPERGVRPRVRAPRSARRQAGRARGADPDGRRPVPRGDGLRDHPAVGACRRRPACRPATPSTAPSGRWPRSSASCARVSATSGPIGTSPGRSSTSGSRRRSSASSASSVRTSPPRRSG